MDPDRQKRKKEISKSLKFIQWEAFCCCCCCYLKAPMKMKPTNVPEWLTSLITRLSDDFSKHVYILSSRSSLAYPEPEGYQVPVVITSTVLCLSPLLNCCCFLFCFPLQPPPPPYVVAWHPSGHSRLHVKSKAWHHFHIFCPFSSWLVWSQCNHSFCTCTKVIPLSGVKKKWETKSTFVFCAKKIISSLAKK